jgi:hypothetical protein
MVQLLSTYIEDRRPSIRARSAGEPANVDFTVGLTEANPSNHASILVWAARGIVQPELDPPTVVALVTVCKRFLLGLLILTQRSYALGLE